MAVGAATHLRSMQAGFSGQGAVLAAELARRGIVGSKEVLEGRYGFFKTYVRTEAGLGRDRWRASGSDFPLLEMHGFKVWPACGYTRPTNAAIRQLREQHAHRARGRRSRSPSSAAPAARSCCPSRSSSSAARSSRIDGKYSIPFTTAVMMAKGNVTLRDYTDEGLRDPAVLAMADSVSYRARSRRRAARRRPLGALAPDGRDSHEGRPGLLVHAGRRPGRPAATR